MQQAMCRSASRLLMRDDKGADMRQQISYHGLDPSPALNEVILERAGQLARLTERLESLRVAVEAPNHRHRHGHHYRVRLELTLPGGDLTIDRNQPVDGEDAFVSVRRAFDALRRRLSTLAERRRGRQRAHVSSSPTIRR
jgi:ribosome-associated translation inhibitor RaiA